MLISFPYLPEYDPGTPRQWAEVTTLGHSELLVHGTYPVGEYGCWHGGVHLRQQTVDQPLRAIADGTVVAYRHAPQKLESGEDNSFILLRHETETGNGRPIRFYSLYMHLLDASATDDLSLAKGNAIIPLMRQASELSLDGKTKVYRKDILGYCGKFDGLPMIHFEIFMTDADFQSYFQHTQLGNDNISQNGDVEMWGDHYWIIPAGQALYDPKSGAYAGAVEKRLLVRIRYERGNKLTTVWEDQGAMASPKLITCKPATHLLGDDEPDHKEIDYEYNLYDTALARYPACPSAGYELLRFGRSFGPDQEQLTAQQSRNLQPIVIAPDTLGYVDVSSADIVKLSDADFPSFMGWARIAESDKVYADDGVCDVKAILAAVNETRLACADDARVTQEKLLPYLRCGRVRDKLRGLICEAPSEWAQSTNTQRYARLLEPGQDFHNQNDEYEKFLRHVEQFQFWDKTGLPTKVWHFHPLAFIEHFRKCRWLSENEFMQLLPRTVLRGTEASAVWEAVPEIYANVTTNVVFTKHRVQLNSAMRKYGIDTPYRMAAFFGNSIQETQWWGKLHEKSTRSWYYPWDGRGFLQLTHASNYIQYWKFRGRKIDPNAEASLLVATKKAHKEYQENQKKLSNEPDKFKRIALEEALQKSNRHLADQVSGATRQIIVWRDEVGDSSQDENSTQENTFSPSDSAGAYWAWTRMAQYSDAKIAFERRKVSTNSGTKIYYRSVAFWKARARVNLPSRVDNPYDHQLNGFIARCVPWAQALAVLSETRFPNADGMPTLEFPEGHERRGRK